MPVGQPTPAIVPESLPNISPQDVELVITRWTDEQVEKLRLFVTDEARRRGLLPPEPASDRDIPTSQRTVRQRRPEVLVEGLAPGQVSAIHQASQAGVKLGKIAQEFGLPLATVKQIIATS